MPVNLSIKNTPDDLAAKLKARAARNHRSLQGELMSILDAAVRDRPEAPADAMAERSRRLTLADVSRLSETLAKPPNETTAMIRADRDR